MIFRLLLNADGGEGNGGKAPEAPPVAHQEPDKGPDLVKAVEGLISRHGDPTAALRVLMGENYTLRDKVREVEKRVAPEGSKVLHGDDLKRWEKYRELGEPADLARGLGERDEYRSKATSYERRDFHAEVARLAGFKAGVLGTLIERDKLEVVIDDLKDDRGNPVGEDGKLLPRDARGVPAAFVKGEGEKLVRLTAYAKDHWGDFLPSLALAEERKPNGTPAANRQRTIPTTAQGAGQGERRAPRSTF